VQTYQPIKSNAQDIKLLISVYFTFQTLMIHHFGKIGCPIGNALGKETVLSKAINNIDVFKIKLASAYDDSKTKYVQMISKLDSGKSVMLELK